MFCPNCKESIGENNICSSCGYNLDDDILEDDIVESINEVDSLNEEISIVDTYKNSQEINMNEISELKNPTILDINSFFETLEVGNEFLSMNIKKILGKNYNGISLLLSDAEELLYCRIIDSSYYKSYEDFYNNVERYRKLNTKNKFQLYDYGKEEGFYYIISTYIEGRYLKDILKEKKNLEPDDAISLTLQLIEELRKLKGEFAHRFINTENIILTKEKELFLLDFGIYYSLSPRAILKLSSMEDEYTDFIAPELINSNSNINPVLSDIFSIGIILNLLLCGKTPQNNANIFFLEDKKKAQQLSKFIENCSHPNPNKRFQNLSVLSSVLLSISSDEVNIPPKKTAPPQLKVPPIFKPASIKDSKLNLPIKENVNEFDVYKNKKGDVTLGELDDVERWFFVKDGIDYGPVSAKKIRELVETKVLTEDTIIKTLTHPIKRGKIKEIELFQNFLKEFQLKNSEEEMQEKMKSFKRKKIITSILVFILLLSIGGGIYYINSRPKEKRFKKKTKEELILDGEKLKKEQELAKKKKEEEEKKLEEEIAKELDEELKASTNPKEEKKVEKKVKKRGKKYYKKYLAMKKKRKALAKKRAEELAKKKKEQETKKMFERNREENKDVADIGFVGGKKAHTLSNSEIKKKLNTKKRAIIDCFIAEYNRGSDLPSSLSITYSVRQNGKFYNVTIQHPKYRKKRGKLNYCIIKVFNSISFKPFNGGTKVGRMPLEFSFE